MNYTRALIASAASLFFVCHGPARAAQSVQPPAAGAASRAPSATNADVWGDSPAARGSLTLAPPPVPADAGKPVPSRHDATRAKPAPRRPPSRYAAPAAHTPVATKEAAAATPSACGELPQKWDRAAALAQAGRPTDALTDYLDLLHACGKPDVLEGTAWKAANALPPAELNRLLADPVFDQQPSLRNSRNTLRLQRMYAENQAGHTDRAVAYSRALRADPSVVLDASALEVSGWLENRAGDDAAAEALFRAALAKAPDTPSARLGLTLALVHEQKLDEAQRQSRGLTTPEGRRLHATVELAVARASRDRARIDAALKLVDETGGATDPATRAVSGWALLDSDRPAQAERIFAQLREEAPQNDEYRQGLALAAAANQDYETLRRLLGENAPDTAPVARQALAAHDERLGLYDHARALTGRPLEGQEPAWQSLFSLDRKSGAPGRDKLTVWTVPQLSITMLPSAWWTVRIDGSVVRLDDGQHHAWGKQLGATGRTEFDQGVLSAGAALSKPGTGPVQALANIQYQRTGEGGDEFFRLAASRDSIYDSLRSFEGSEAAGTGPAVSSSLQAAAREAIGGSSFYLGESLALGAVTASGTSINPFYAASVSLTHDFRVKGWSWLNAGPELRISSYRYDANRFDGPYAGYWSPKSNREAGLLFYAQSDEGGRFLFKTGGRIGFASRQLYTGRASGEFAENTTTLAGLVSSRLILGAGIGYRVSPGYHDMNVFAWLKIPLEARGHLRATDLVTPRGF